MTTTTTNARDLADLAQMTAKYRDFNDRKRRRELAPEGAAGRVALMVAEAVETAAFASARASRVKP